MQAKHLVQCLALMCSTDVSYILLFLSLCYVPEAVLGAGDAAMNKTGSLPHSTHRDLIP